jgi:hypothetical protein
MFAGISFPPVLIRSRMALRIFMAGIFKFIRGTPEQLAG